MASPRWGRAFVGQALLLFSLAAPAPAVFEIRDSRLYRDGERFVVRGVVYSNAPIRHPWADTMTDAGCLYPRDLPLVKALGANTIRTLAKVPPAEQAFRKSLQASDLYWLAGFPLERFYNPAQTLSPDSAQGQSLRAQILEEFVTYVAAWREEPRLIAFVFGNEVATDYAKKFSGPASDFYSLLREAAALARRDPASAVLVTTAAGEDRQIGDPKLGTQDAAQPDLAFWLFNRLGVTPLEGTFHELRSRTGKPFLLAFGADAFDQRKQTEDDKTQAKAAGEHARAIQAAADAGLFPLLGGLWTSLLDEWWRGSDSPAQHGTEGRPANLFLDGFLNPAWLGLFRVQPSGMAGLDRLRPREAYFALAQEWGGPAFSESGGGAGPSIDEQNGITHFASSSPVVAAGGLVRFRGQGYASAANSVSGSSLPFELETVSACIGNQPVPLFHADANEIRGQVPWEAPFGKTPAAVVRQGLVSNIVEAEVAPFAPGIFDNGVVWSGHPCPLDENNGVPPGSYVEIYGSGLGPTDPRALTGQAAEQVLSLANAPRVLWGDQELPVVFSGLLPNFVGIYQTNARLPGNAPRRTADLRLVQGNQQSNAYPLRVAGEQDRPAFTLTDPEPNTLIMQRGGPTQVAYVRIKGMNSFCDPVAFEFTGLPAGVIASSAPGFPGQTVPLYVQANPNAALAENSEAFLIGRSSAPGSVRRSFAVTILPSLGNVRFQVISGGWLSNAPIASFKTDDHLLYEAHGGGTGRGFNFLTVDAETGALGVVRNFDTWGNAEQVSAMENYLRSLTAGTLVLAAIADDGQLLITSETRRIVRETLASRAIDALGYQYSWAIISRKGAAEPLAEGISANETVVLDRVLTFPLR